MEILTILYTVSGFIVAAAYLPQIVRLLGDDTGASAMSLIALSVFSVCTVIGFAYACLVNGDIFMMLDYGLCSIGEVAVLILASIRRLQYSTTPLNQAIFSLIPAPISRFATRL